MTKGNRVMFSVAKRSLEKQLTGFRNELSAISPNSRSTSRRQAKRAQNLKLRISTLDALQRNEAVNRDVCTMSDTVMLKWVVESMPEASQGFSCTNSDGQLKGNYTVTNVDLSEKLVEITFTANRRDKVVDVYNCNLGGEAESSTVIHWLDA
uniref:Uncharacterized protein n=2 Tax=Schistocephalus solidus TaxID=70667 RepID=A0A0V0JB52_SCHSO